MNRSLKLRTLILSTATVAMLTAVPVFSEPVTVTSEDGLVTITLPDDKWVQVPSTTNSVVFSDGDCAILFDVYRSNDTLPGFMKKDAQHVVVYNAATATEDYVFIATGLVTSEEDYNDIRGAINGIEVHQEKITDAMLEHTVNPDDFYIETVSYPAWISADVLNVRDDSSKEGNVLTIGYKGDQVEVTGIVKMNGEDTGWARIEIEGLEGFVSSQFLSTNQVEIEDEENESSTNPYNTYPFTVYYPDGTPYTLYLDNEGYAHDASETYFDQGQDGVWRNEQYGVYFYNYKPENSYDVYDTSIYVSSEEGDDRVLTNGGSDVYFDDYGIEYSHVREGVWLSAEGIYYYE